MVAAEEGPHGVVDLGPRQAAYRGSTLSVPSLAARRLLGRLDKLQMIELALHWMCGTDNTRHPPSLSRASRAPGAGDLPPEPASLADAISTERRVGSYHAARALWDGPMRDDRVPKVRALDRILTVDWPDGLSFAMIADVDAVYLASHPESRQWAAARLIWEENKGGSVQMDPSQLQANLSRELQLYFGHYTYLFPPEAAAERVFSTPREKGLTPTWFGVFTAIRVCAAPLPTDVCGRGATGALWLLHIPQTPWVLYSGAMGRQDSPTEARKLALHAFAQAIGAQHVDIPSQSSTSGGPAPCELKGRDALGLRSAILRAHAPSGGQGVALLDGTAENGPLTESVHRRREGDSVRAYGLPPPSQGPEARDHAAREREARSVFGPIQGERSEDYDLIRTRRADYEMRLPFPPSLLGPEYRVPTPKLLSSHPIQLQLNGSHVISGLRKIVLAGLDVDETLPDLDDPSPTARHGLPLWLTEVRGSNITVGERP